MTINRHLDMRMIRESLLALIIALFADTFAGYFLQSYVDLFKLIPGILMVIPALIDMRGNIYGAFISRLSSKLHLGEVKNLKDREIRIGIFTSQSLAFFTATIVGVIAGLYSLSKMNDIHYFLLIPAIILLTQLFTTSILTPLTAYLGVKSYEKGWNPDNIGVPLISASGDTVSVMFIIAVAFLLIKFSSNAWVLSLVIVLILTYMFYLMLKTLKDKGGKSVFLQSMPVLLLVASLELITGSLWEGNKVAIILLILPAVLETLGNIGSVFSSRLSSSLYLGLVEPGWLPHGKHMKREIASTGVLSIVTYSLISIFVFLITLDLRGILLVFSSMALAVSAIILLSYYLTMISLKMRLDPDNVVIPVITTLADIVGTSSVILFYAFIF